MTWLLPNGLPLTNTLGMTITGEGPATTSQARSVPADSFGNRLMLARAHAGHVVYSLGRILSIREAADLCGLGRGAWTNWERGARPIGESDIVRIVSEKLGVDPDWLRDGGPLAIAQPIRRRHQVKQATLRYHGGDRKSTRAHPAGLTHSAKATRPPRTNADPGNPDGRGVHAGTAPKLRRPAVRAQRLAA